VPYATDVNEMSPVGDTAAAFLSQAVAEGWPLRRGSAVTWLTNRGHANTHLVEGLDTHMLASLRDIFLALNGDETELASIGERALPPDFFLGELNRVVELDESQHFTSARLKTLDLYPEGIQLGFDLAEYREFCQTLSEASDRDFSHKTARQFPGPHGRQRQRAYFDALRDLAAPAFGQGPVIRVPAPERDSALAFSRFEDSVRSHYHG